MISYVLILADYFFYRTYDFFKERSSEVTETKAAGFVAIVESFTLFDLAIMFRRFVYQFEFQGGESRLYIGLVVLAVFGFNIVRYESKSRIEAIQEKWGKENRRERERRGLVVVLYIVLVTLGLFVPK